MGAGSEVDPGKPIRFRFDGRFMQGFAGDTLASALLANGVRVLARSFKYHRPRGVLSAGSEEPNALVDVIGTGAREPNLLATTLRSMPNDVYFQIGFLTTLGLSTKNAILIIQFIKEQMRQGDGLIQGPVDFSEE